MKLTTLTILDRFTNRLALAVFDFVFDNLYRLAPRRGLTRTGGLYSDWWTFDFLEHLDKNS